MADLERLLWYPVCDLNFYNWVLALLLFAIVGIAYFIGTLLDEGGRGRVKEFFLGLFKPRNNG